MNLLSPTDLSPGSRLGHTMLYGPCPLDTRAMLHNLYLKMATAGSKEPRCPDDLTHLPHNFSVESLPNCDGIPSKVRDKGLSFSMEQYIHDVKMYCMSSMNPKRVDVKCKCWRSTRKTRPPHVVHISLVNDAVEDLKCSCTAGWVDQYSI